MSDEIKESNTPNHILSALGDLTNGAINYYQLPKVTLKEQKMILDYITNLQKIEREYSSLLSENAELQQENDRLNNIRQYAIQFININQHEKTFVLDYYDLKKLRGILNDDEFYIELFKEQLKESKENNNAKD